MRRADAIDRVIRSIEKGSGAVVAPGAEGDADDWLAWSVSSMSRVQFLIPNWMSRCGKLVCVGRGDSGVTGSGVSGRRGRVGLRDLARLGPVFVFEVEAQQGEEKR